ncbi:hypothetical protein [Natronomonas sp. EA1]|uniref:hypothetical protein n=1 Tax=Natronomonas sp. EA1 TaxID=3421655 RepID=UPI003EBCA39B
MNRTGVGGLLENERRNAVLAWLLVGFVLVVAAGHLATGSLLWAGFAVVVAVLACLPPAVARNLEAMLPWEVLLLAALPLLGQVFAQVPVTGDIAAYLSVAALALMVAVELHLLTPVEMSYRFAVAFVVITTMAAAGVWAVVRYGSDLYLGTSLLLPPVRTEAALERAERELMIEFAASFIAGVVAGVVFEFYFRRRKRADAAALGIEGGA